MKQQWSHYECSASGNCAGQRILFVAACYLLVGKSGKPPKWYSEQLVREGGYTELSEQQAIELCQPMLLCRS
jgi:hypothetical protein